ncbi:MAG: hypothetical protein GX998_10020 [Firmicutes bacterium]|nr:hypothetical protein [Bacillota bacterium]
MDLPRRLLFLFIAAVMLVSGFAYATSPIQILINGRSPDLELQTHFVDGEIFVPLEAIARLLGAEIEWSPDKSSVSISTVELSNLVTTQPEKPAEASETITVYITKTGSKYHRAGCRHLSKGMIPTSLDDAKSRGLSPCSVCKPPY